MLGIYVLRSLFLKIESYGHVASSLPVLENAKLIMILPLTKLKKLVNRFIPDLHYFKLQVTCQMTKNVNRNFMKFQEDFIAGFNYQIYQI